MQSPWSYIAARNGRSSDGIGDDGDDFIAVALKFRRPDPGAPGELGEGRGRGGCDPREMGVAQHNVRGNTVGLGPLFAPGLQSVDEARKFTGWVRDFERRLLLRLRRGSHAAGD